MTQASESTRARLRKQFDAFMTPDRFGKLLEEVYDRAVNKHDWAAQRTLLDQGLGRPSAAGTDEETGHSSGEESAASVRRQALSAMGSEEGSNLLRLHPGTYSPPAVGD